MAKSLLDGATVNGRLDPFTVNGRLDPFISEIQCEVESYVSSRQSYSSVDLRYAHKKLNHLIEVLVSYFLMGGPFS